MKYQTHSCRAFKQFAAVLGVLFVTLLIAPTQASAQSSSKQLTDYLSSQEQVVLGLNFDRLRKSKYFGDVTKMANGNASVSQVISLLADADIDFSTDITALTVGVPVLDVQKSLEQRTFSAVISGKFDNAKLLSALKAKKIDFKSSKLGKRTLYTHDNIVFTFAKKGVLLMASGPDGYRTRAVQALANSKKSVAKTDFFKNIIDGVKTSQGVWMVANAATAPASASAKAKANEVAMSLDVTSGLMLEILFELENKKSAAEILGQLNSMSQQFANNPMVAMVGAKPLVANLKSSQNGTRVTTTTRLNPAELDNLLKNAGQMLQSKLQGSGAVAPTPKTKATPTQKDGAAPAPKPIKADFN